MRDSSITGSSALRRIGHSTDGRTGRWKVKCPMCQKTFEPRTAMHDYQEITCPGAKCGASIGIIYNAGTVRIVE